MKRPLVLGTRGSRLAMAQAEIAAARLKQAAPSLTVQIRTITTAGDRDRNSQLSEIGGKGVFVRELEQALLDGEIDIAVHSFKDITVQGAAGAELCAFFRPESVCDVLVSRGGTELKDLPRHARIGTGSLRRRALLSRMRPDAAFADIRGNIDTRLRRLDTGMFDALVVSEAGLVRLGLEKRISQRFDPETFYPAPGQGVITLQIRQRDEDIRRLCLAAGDEDQCIVSNAELALLEHVGFDCRTPMGVHTVLEHDVLRMRGFSVGPGGDVFTERQASGLKSAPTELGRTMGRLLRGERT
jgi:hydroxymethylbilane synthase